MLLDLYRAGQLLAGRLPLVLDGALDGLGAPGREAAVQALAQADDLQTIVVSDDVEVMQSVAIAGGTLVRWPQLHDGDQRRLEGPVGSDPRRMIAPERVRAVVDAYVDSYRRNDKQACVDLFAADADWHDPVGEPPHVGHEGVGAFWDQARAMAESIELVPSDVIVCANQAAMVFEIHVTIGGATARRPR